MRHVERDHRGASAGYGRKHPDFGSAAAICGPGGSSVIDDLSREVSGADIDREINRMGLGRAKIAEVQRFGVSATRWLGARAPADTSTCHAGANAGTATL